MGMHIGAAAAPENFAGFGLPVRLIRPNPEQHRTFLQGFREFPRVRRRFNLVQKLEERHSAQPCGDRTGHGNAEES